jgi:DNA mismatch endonuclease, patch repair protein
MASVHSKDTKPELIVRRLVHRLGYRYRLHRTDLPGAPDLVFPGRRKIIFIHGCFWHGHDCRAGRKRPKTNEDYWLNKLARNKRRDAEHQTKLRTAGWEVLVLWECQLKDRAALQQALVAFLSVAPTTIDSETSHES